MKMGKRTRPYLEECNERMIVDIAAGRAFWQRNVPASRLPIDVMFVGYPSLDCAILERYLFEHDLALPFFITADLFDLDPKNPIVVKEDQSPAAYLEEPGDGGLMEAMGCYHISQLQLQSLPQFELPDGSAIEPTHDNLAQALRSMENSEEQACEEVFTILGAADIKVTHKPKVTEPFFGVFTRSVFMRSIEEYARPMDYYVDAIHQYCHLIYVTRHHQYAKAGNAEAPEIDPAREHLAVEIATTLLCSEIGLQQTEVRLEQSRELSQKIISLLQRDAYALEEAFDIAEEIRNEHFIRFFFPDVQRS